MRGGERVGTELAGYRLERLLGRGGMGEVYLAQDLRLKRKVALKLLPAARAEDQAFRERFLAESELAASIDHPNIVPIYEAGEILGSLFIAMRYVEGTDLKHMLREGPPLPGHAIGLLAQVAEALDAAHGRGLVHRDVKPSNIIVAPGTGPGGTDHVYLADFGLTKRLADPGAIADDGQLMGTVDYVAPEQIAGENIDGRADQYSLGCLMYECLTGSPPFERESDVAALFAHLEEPAPTVTERRPDLSDAIDPVIATALAKSPDDRYATCRELVTTARQALGIAETAPSRRLRASVLVAVVSIALVAAGLAALLASNGPDAPRDTLVRIDPATNEVKDSLAVGDRASSVDVGDGYVWVTSFGDRSLWRVDPESLQTRATRVEGSPLDVVVRDGLAVVASGPFEVSVHRINAATGALIESIPLESAEGSMTSVAEGDEGIWVGACGYGGGNVGRVSEAASAGGNLTALDRLEVYSLNPNWIFGHTDDFPAYTDVAVGFGSVWLAGESGPTLRRIDADTGHLDAMIRLPFLPKSITVGGGTVWITALVDDALVRVDPTTNEAGTTIRLGPGTDGVAFGDGSVWVVGSVDGTLTRLDPESGEIQATIHVEGLPEDVVVGAGGVWVTTHTA